MYAFRNGHVDLIRVLLQRTDIKLKPTSDDDEVLLFYYSQILVDAVKITKVNMCDIIHELLYKHHMDVNSDNSFKMSALMFVYDTPEYAAMLFKHSHLDINKVDYRGNTALIHACNNLRQLTEHRIPFINMLLRRGININSVNQSGFTALMNICNKKRHFGFREDPIDLVELLCTSSSDITIQDC